MAVVDKSLGLVPLTLFLLLVLATAQSNINVTLTVRGKAKCKYNPSMVIRNAPLHMMINGTTVVGSTGRTTSTGEIVMAVSLTSPVQVKFLTSNSTRVLLVTPPHACGAPSLPPKTVVATHLQVTDSSLANLGSSSILATVSEPFSCLAAC